MIFFDQDARDQILEGAEILYKAVSTSLGSRGQNVGIESGWGRKIVHDGVTIAKAVTHKDPSIQFSMDVLKEAAKKQVNQVGDGTTVVTVLSYHILKEAMKRISSGVHPMQLQEQLFAEMVVLEKHFADYTKPITELEKITQVATISAADPGLGKLVGELMQEIGKDGLVDVVESKESETRVEMAKGMVFDRGYVSPYFVNIPEQKVASLTNAQILVTDIPITTIQQLVPFFNKHLPDVTSLVIIAPDISGDALGTLLANKINGKLSSLAIRAPGYGPLQLENLEDIATLTGATLISQEKQMTLKDLTIEDLGECERVTSSENATTITNGAGNQEEIDERVALITAQMKGKSDFDLLKLKERKARLTSGIAVIRVGGATEIEVSDRIERVKDSVGATRAAMQSGVVAGGELIYLKLRTHLQPQDFLYSVLAEPFKKLTQNAGLDGGQYLQKIEDAGEDYGVNVDTGEIVDMFYAGIIDPSRVSVSALRNSVSVATKLFTTQVLIAPEEKEDV